MRWEQLMTNTLHSPASNQDHSIAFVCATVTGSTYYCWCFTVHCWYPMVFRLL